MNEEEKEAIKTIKSFKNMKWYSHAFDRGVEILTEEERREIDIIINLIKKQQEQIEELRETCNKYNDMKYFAMTADRYISKDKIKKKIEEITSYAYTSAAERDCQDYVIQSLKELLGE